jgi:predicted metal-binding membrane protein
MMTMMFIANSLWQGFMGMYLLGCPDRAFGHLNDNGRNAGRLVGATFIGLSLISWLSLDSAKLQVGKSIGFGLMVYHTLDSLVAFASFQRSRDIEAQQILHRRSFFAGCLHAIFAFGFSIAYIWP